MQQWQLPKLQEAPWTILYCTCKTRKYHVIEGSQSISDQTLNIGIALALCCSIRKYNLLNEWSHMRKQNWVSKDKGSQSRSDCRGGFSLQEEIIYREQSYSLKLTCFMAKMVGNGFSKINQLLKWGMDFCLKLKSTSHYLKLWHSQITKPNL